MKLQFPPEIQALAGKLESRVFYCEITSPIPIATTKSPKCENCKDIGYMYFFFVDSGPFQYPPQGKNKSAKLIDDVWYLGSLNVYPCPACQSDLRAVFLMNNCGIRGDDLGIKIENLHEYPGKENTLKAAQKIISEEPMGFVSFCGDYGTGKTTALKGIVNAFRLKMIYSVFVEMSELLADVRDGFGDDSTLAAEKIIGDYKNVKVLAIDEIDRINKTPWAMETMHRVVNARYEARDQLLTVLASNKTPDELDVDLGYLASRMRGGLVVLVGGKDVREFEGRKEQKRYGIDY